MEMAVARSQLSDIDIGRVAAHLVDDVVSAFRNHGHTREHAVTQAALALELTPRRTKSLLYGEVVAFTAAEFERLHTKFLDHLDAEADRLEAKSAALRMRRQQMELEL